MKKFAFVALTLVLLFGAVSVMAKGDKAKGPKKECTTIQDQVLTYSNNPEIIPLGFDKWGYNYQGHMFNGFYANYTRPSDPVEDDDMWLKMKWSDEWLSNKDCNGDGKLDRGYSCDPVNASSSGCPGAWLTNHIRGEYEQDGETCKWNYFTKIVAAPADAYKEGGIWYTADGTEIGPVIWGAYATIMEVSNDPCAGEHGLQFKSPVRAGLGNW